MAQLVEGARLGHWRRPHLRVALRAAADRAVRRFLVAVDAPGLAAAADVLVAENDARPGHRAAQLLRELEIAREHLPVRSGEKQSSLHAAQRLLEVGLQLGMDRNRFLGDA